ncbi:hypothetical protein LTR22_027624 [Elasticomyces elasticus]|nr:hypothetical protein LTR22_027624 [Elasticomyces elasticus]
MSSFLSTSTSSTTSSKSTASMPVVTPISDSMDDSDGVSEHIDIQAYLAELYISAGFNISAMNPKEFPELDDPTNTNSSTESSAASSSSQLSNTSTTSGYPSSSRTPTRNTPSSDYYSDSTSTISRDTRTLPIGTSSINDTAVSIMFSVLQGIGSKTATLSSSMEYPQTTRSTYVTRTTQSQTDESSDPAPSEISPSITTSTLKALAMQTSSIAVVYDRTNEQLLGSSITSDNAFIVWTFNTGVPSAPDYCNISWAAYFNVTDESSLTSWSDLQQTPGALPYPDQVLSLMKGGPLDGGQTGCQYSFDYTSGNGGVFECGTGLSAPVTCTKREFPFDGATATACGSGSGSSALQTFLPLIDCEWTFGGE